MVITLCSNSQGQEPAFKDLEEIVRRDLSLVELMDILSSWTMVINSSANNL